MSAVDEYRCPVAGCTYHVLAAGPLDPDEPDYFEEEVAEHRRTHALPDEGDTVRLHGGGEAIVRSVIRGRRGVVHHYLVLADGYLSTVFPREIAGYPEDDGTEAESLAEVQPPAFPDVQAHGRSRVGAA